MLTGPTWSKKLREEISQAVIGQDEVVERLPCFPDKAFCVGVAVGGLEWSFDDLHVLGFEYFVESMERSVIVVDEIFYPAAV